MLGSGRLSFQTNGKDSNNRPHRRSSSAAITAAAAMAWRRRYSWTSNKLSSAATSSAATSSNVESEGPSGAGMVGGGVPDSDVLQQSTTPVGAQGVEYKRTLCEALLKMDWARAETLLVNGNEGIWYVDPYGRSVLHTAVAQKAPASIIRMLMEKGLDPTMKDMSFRRTPIHVAVFSNSPPEVFEILLDNGRICANLTDKFGLNPLSYITKQALNYESIGTLLRLGKCGNESMTFLTAIRNAAPVALVQAFLRSGVSAPHQAISSALRSKSQNGDHTAYLLIKVPLLFTMCAIMFARKSMDPPLPALPSELLRELMYMLFGREAPRYRPL